MESLVIWIVVMIAGALIEKVAKARKRIPREPARDYRAAPEESMVRPSPYVVRIPTPDIYSSDAETYDQEQAATVEAQPVEEAVVVTQEAQQYDERIAIRPKREKRKKKQKQQEPEAEQPAAVAAHRVVFTPQQVPVPAMRPKRKVVFNTANARQAIIWMEVFGKPKGLQ